MRRKFHLQKKMARVTHKMSGGMARANLVEHNYYLKPVPMNPYLGAVHDGRTELYNEGFSAKHIPFLYRFRHNLFPGWQTGFFCRNPNGKFVHWLEVSTIEKMRVRVMSEEAFPPLMLFIAVNAFTLYHCWRLFYHHPDITLSNVTIWTTKPWVQQMRFSQKHPMDKPTWRYVDRATEYYQQDPIRFLYEQGIPANDAYLTAARAAGATNKDWTRTAPVLDSTVRERTVASQPSGHSSRLSL